MLVCILFSSSYFSERRSNPRDCRLDHAQLTTSFELLRERLSSHDIDYMILIAFNTGLLPNLPEPHPSPESLRIFHIILSYPLAKEYPACLSIIVTFVKVFLYISDKAKDIIGRKLIIYHCLLISVSYFFFALFYRKLAVQWSSRSITDLD